SPPRSPRRANGGWCAAVESCASNNRNLSVNAIDPLHSQRRPIPEGFIEALRERFGDRMCTSAAVCEHHGTDESPYETMPPDEVVYATSTEEVAWVAAHCHSHRVPLIPYGAGPSFEGHLLAVPGGVSLD